MPPQRPKNPPTSNLVITIKYGGIKATQFFSKYTAESYNQLLNDLTELGFPHPKRTNIVFKSHGTLEFFWPIEPNETSNFVKNLMRRVTLPHNAPFKDDQLSTRKELSIISMTIKEDMDYNPYLEPLQPPQSLPGEPKAMRNGPGQFPKPFTRTPGERFHPYARPPDNSQNSVGSQEHDPAYNRGNQPAQTTPVSSSAPAGSNRCAAQVFLDDMKSSLEPPTKIKPEPSEPSIPLPPAETPSAKTVQRGSRFPPRKMPTPEVQVKQEPSPPRHPHPTHRRDHLPSRTFIDLTQPSNTTTSTAPPSTARDATLGSKISGLASLPQKPSSFNSSMTHSGAFEVPTNSVFSSSLAATPTDTFAAPIRGLPPLSQERWGRPSVQSLTENLLSLKKGMHLSVEAQHLIIDQLLDMNATDIPAPLSITTEPDSRDGISTKRSIEELEQELRIQKAKSSELDRELQAERLKRQELELILADIERERAAPFIVPALLQAFVKISQATTAAIQYKPSLNSEE